MHSGKKALAFCLALTIIVMLLAGCTKKNTGKGPEELIQDCKKLSGTALESCLYGIGVSGVEQACAQLTDSAKKDDCLALAAKAKNNPKTCLRVIDSAKREACDLSLQQQNSGDCAKLPGDSNGQRDNCLYNAAQSSKDIQSCLQISNSEVKSSCVRQIASTTGSIGQCAQINGSDEQLKRECVSEAAKKLQSECGKIGPLDERNNCYYTLAVQNSEGGPCGKIAQDSNLSDKCLDESADTDSSNCLKISDKNIMDDCILRISSASLETKDCNAVSDSAKKILCVSTVAVALADESICGKILDFGASNNELSRIFGPGKDNCIIEIAGLKADENVCSMLYSTAAKAPECFGAVAAAKADANTCLKLPAGALSDQESFSKQDTCHYVFAQKTSDESACAKIHSQESRLKCECIFNSGLQGCTPRTGTLSITVKSFDGNLLTNIGISVFKGLQAYYSLVNNVAEAVTVSNVVDGNFIIAVNDRTDRFLPDSKAVEVAGGSYSFEFLLNQNCASSMKLNGFQGGKCCYSGQVLGGNGSAYSTAGPEYLRIACVDAILYACGSTNCASECVQVAESGTAGNLTCNANGWS